MSRHWQSLLVGALLCLAAALRCGEPGLGWFGVDQARDLAWADAIVAQGELPTMGPLMRGRVHLGALYYFFWAIPRLASDDPVAGNLFAGLLGVGTVLGAFALGRRVGGGPVGVAAALLLATSPTAVVDARVAWAPAAIPAASAVFLLACVALLRRPGPGSAFVASGVAALATQLHLSALPWLGVAGGAVVLRRRVLGARGIAAALAALLLALGPMALAWRLDARQGDRAGADLAHRDTTASAPTSAAGAADPGPLPSGISRSVAATLVERWRALPVAMVAPLAATTAPATRGWALRAVLATEPVLGVLSIAAALVLTVAPGWVGAAPLVGRLVAGVGLLGVLAVLALPGEAWAYYLDATLVPLAIALATLACGVAAAGPRWRRGAVGVLLVGVAGLRVIALCSWLAGIARDGFLPVDLALWNLDTVREASARGDAGRARVPTLAVKQEAVARVLDVVGTDPARIRFRFHGPGAGDLDGDNGALFRRDLSARPASPGSAQRAHVALLARGDLPAEWGAGSAPGHTPDVGPWHLFPYRPAADAESARVEGCGPESTPLPSWPLADPRDYGHGAPALPEWPCADPTLVVPVDPSDLGGSELRVFLRPVGAIRVTSIDVEPAAERLDSIASRAGSGPGVLLRGGAPATIRARLQVSGPGFVDVWELHGSRTP